LRVGEPGVGSERPVVAVDRRPDRDQRPAGVALEQENARFLHGQLTLDAGLPPLEQVLDLGAEPVGDDPQDPDRRPRLAHLHLVEEGTAEVVSDHGRKTHPAIGSDPADTLAEAFLLFHRARTLA
jgi:hypothetical protein